MPVAPEPVSLSGVAVPLQVTVVTATEEKDAVFVTKPPLPSGRRQRSGTKLPFGTRFSAGDGRALPRKPSKLKVSATLKLFVTAVVKFAESFAVTLNVRAPAIFVFTAAPSGFVLVHDS